MRRQKLLIALLLVTSGLLWISSLRARFQMSDIFNITEDDAAIRQHLLKQISELKRLNSATHHWRDLTSTEVSHMSVLGRRLFLDDNAGDVQQQHNFTILVWKKWEFISTRLINRFTDHMFDPFADCSAANCRLTAADEDAATADVVLFHLHRMSPADSLPATRHPGQRWVWMTDESPEHTFLDPGNSLHRYRGLFNWSMSYRMDCDVPVPYGRAVLLPKDEPWLHNTSRYEKLMAAMISNCGSRNHRLEYILQLQKSISVDVYGECGTLSCPGHFNMDCPLLNGYKFYLAFENSNCREYITEKAWWNAYEKEAVPVIMGISRRDAFKLLPPASYIHVDDFASPEELAAYLLYLHENNRAFSSYFQWKTRFKIVNEHGYFQSPVYHLCRLCEALNYNDPAPKVYDLLTDFWNVRRDCRNT